jgi:hypothetical protein
MKNMENCELISAITMSLENFTILVEKLTNGGIKVLNYGPNSLLLNEGAINKKLQWDGNILDALSEYFDVKVTGWQPKGHCKFTNPTMVYIYFKESE